MAEKVARIKRQATQRQQGGNPPQEQQEQQQEEYRRLQEEYERKEAEKIDAISAIDWFSGSVSAAIAEAKSRKSLFVVAVVKSPESSDDNADFFSSLAKVEVGKNVFVKIVADSTSFGQFNAIYPVKTTPALFIVNSANGAKLKEMTSDFKSVDAAFEMAKTDMALTLKALEKVKKPKDDVEEDVNSPRRIAVDKAKKALEEATDAAKDEDATKAEAGQKPMTLEERVAWAKKVVAGKQAQRETESAEEEKRREKERRLMGQQIGEMKRKQEEDNLRKAAEERRKDKEEEKIAREKIKRQIEEDRRERNERFNAEKEQRRRDQEEKHRKELEAEAKRAEEEIQARSSKARIQFRLPDGRSVTKQFGPDEPLSVLYDYVANDDKDVRVPFKRFALNTTFPSRKLDNEDRRMSLRRLGLVPSSTVLILPVGNNSVSAQTALSVSGIIWLILTPLTVLWNFFSAFFSADSAPQRAHVSSQRQPQQGGRGGASTGAVRRRTGNMARLQDLSDNDDENNTYNGNSTQQM